MATRLAWWTIPATAVVMVRVVTLPMGQATAEIPAALAIAQPAPLAEVAPSLDTVVLRDAAGSRSSPLLLSVDGALTFQLPVASRRVDFTLRRYAANEQSPALWLQGTPRVRADGTMPILGLPAGRYAVEIAWTDAEGVHRIARDDLLAPGTFDLRQSAVAR